MKEEGGVLRNETEASAKKKWKTPQLNLIQMIRILAFVKKNFFCSIKSL